MSAPPTPSSRDPVHEGDCRFRPLGTPCEWSESYHPSGFHPVHLGDIFNGHYEVIRKLGNGSFATVWLALDSIAHRYVVLKIEVAKLYGANQPSIQQSLASKGSKDEDSRFVVALLDSFYHDGPNGKHPCLVLEPMGPSVSSILNAPRDDPLNRQPRRFPKQQTKEILRNVLRGLRFLHSNGVVHGDLHSGNILFATRNLNSVSVEELRQDLKKSRMDTLERVDGKVDKWAPKYLVTSQPLNEYTLLELERVVKIIDIGGAFLETDPPGSVVTPSALRAPESILGCPLSCSIDIWSFGCLVFELLTGMPLIQLSPFHSDEVLDDHHLLQLTDIIQPLPEDLLAKWRRADRYYGPSGERLNVQPWDFGGSDGSDGGCDAEDEEDYDECEGLERGDLPQDEPPIRITPEPYESLEKLFRDDKPDDIDEDEEKVITSLLRSILQHNPLKRPSAADLLDHPWIKA